LTLNGREEGNEEIRKNDRIKNDPNVNVLALGYIVCVKEKEKGKHSLQLDFNASNKTDWSSGY